MVSVKDLTNDILTEIVGSCDNTKSSVVKINSTDLSENGDISFPTNLKIWTSVLKNNCQNANNNILEYYLKRNGIDTSDLSIEQINYQAVKRLLSASQTWKLSIGSASLRKEKICLFLNRPWILTTTIKNVIEQGSLYGRGSGLTKRVEVFQVHEDPQSELTTARLEKIKYACSRVVSKWPLEFILFYSFLLTSKSEVDAAKCIPCNDKYLCGVVKNVETNSKETSLTLEQYLQLKVDELTRINESRPSSITCNESWINTIADAVITFEFLSVKVNQPVFIRTNDCSSRNTANNKGGAFVLYNFARISAILDKFEEENMSENYPDLWDIDEVNFEELSLEEEWSLVYNFILSYPSVLSSVVQVDGPLRLNLHNLCSFLSHLSQEFSVYYRRTRILTKACEHLLPTMMARIYMLKALQVVIGNALEMLGISPLPRM